MKTIWPTFLDIPEVECKRLLRELEINAYESLVNVLRAQGAFNENKKRFLNEAINLLHIPPQRHRAELRKVANDEKLNTIASFVDGNLTAESWYKEGARPCGELLRSPAPTVCLPLAKKVAEYSESENATLPLPTLTSRELRSASREMSPNVGGKTISHSPTRTMKYDPPPGERSKKKRRMSVEKTDWSPTSSLAYDGYVPHGIEQEIMIEAESLTGKEPTDGLFSKVFRTKSGGKAVRYVPNIIANQKKSNEDYNMFDTYIMPPPSHLRKLTPKSGQAQIKNADTMFKSSSSFAEVTEVIQLQPPQTPTTPSSSNLLSSSQMPKVSQITKILTTSGSSPSKGGFIKITPNTISPHSKVVIVSSPLSSFTSTPTNKVSKEISGSTGGATVMASSSSGDIHIRSVEPINNKVLHKVIPSNQIIIQKGQITSIQSTTAAAHTSTGGDKTKLVTVQAKIKPSGSVVLQNTSANTNVTMTTTTTSSSSPMPLIQGVQWKNIQNVQGKNFKVVTLGNNAKIIKSTKSFFVMNKSGNIIPSKRNVIEAVENKAKSGEIKTVTYLKKSTDDLTNNNQQYKILPLNQQLKKSPQLSVVTSTPSTTTSSSSPQSIVVSTTPSSTSNNNNNKTDTTPIIKAKDEGTDDVDEKTPKKKSNLLADALHASGVTSLEDDIESQISQYTEIPGKQTTPPGTRANNIVTTSSDKNASTTDTTKSNMNFMDAKYLTIEDAVAFLGDTPETRRLLAQLENDDSTPIISPADSSSTNENVAIITNTTTTTTTTTTNVSISTTTLSKNELKTTPTSSGSTPSAKEGEGGAKRKLISALNKMATTTTNVTTVPLKTQTLTDIIDKSLENLFNSGEDDDDCNLEERDLLGSNLIKEKTALTTYIAPAESTEKEQQSATTVVAPDTSTASTTKPAAIDFDQQLLAELLSDR